MNPVFTWDGECLTPDKPRLADEAMVIGQKYEAREIGQRSRASHNHYFALVHEAWLNLPEHVSGWWKNDEHLRKWALIKSGHCDAIVIAGEGADTASRLALGDYTLIVRDGGVLTAYTAHSQSEAAMGRATFQKSKDDVLRVLSELIGVDVTELEKAA